MTTAGMGRTSWRGGPDGPPEANCRACHCRKVKDRATAPCRYGRRAGVPHFDAVDHIGNLVSWTGAPAGQRGREALAVRPSVFGAVSPACAERLRGFLRARGSARSRRIDVAITAGAAAAPAA
jgi:hypothetical protein